MLRIIVHNVMRLFYECPKLRKGKASLHVTVTASMASQFRELERSHQNIEYQHIERYFYANVFKYRKRDSHL